MASDNGVARGLDGRFVGSASWHYPEKSTQGAEHTTATALLLSKTPTYAAHILPHPTYIPPRTQFCAMDTQERWFERQFELAREFDLPMFLHLRAAAPAFLAILGRQAGVRGVVHSFDGSQEEAAQILSHPGLFIGVNGCSLKTGKACLLEGQCESEKLRNLLCFGCFSNWRLAWVCYFVGRPLFIMPCPP